MPKRTHALLRNCQDIAAARLGNCPVKTIRWPIIGARGGQARRRRRFLWLCAIKKTLPPRNKLMLTLMTKIAITNF